QTFAGLSVLAGATFPREGALAVAEAGGGKAASDLGILVDYSLVEALPGGRRLRLHPQLREYATEQLATLPAETQEQLGAAALAWWIAYVQAHLGYERMDTLEAEAEGLMGAMAWANAHQRHSQLRALAGPVGRVWDIRGRRAEELQIDNWALQAAEASGD